MTLRNYTLTFSGSIQSLGTLLVSEGIQDVPVYAIDIQADASNANAFYIGGADVDGNTGIRFPVPVTSIPDPPYRLGDFANPGLALADIFVLGTNGQKAHVLVFA